MSANPNRAGGCEWLGNDVRVQYARCWSCMLGSCPGGPHDWADSEDVDHAKAMGQPDPTGQSCGCVCADGPELAQPYDDEPEWVSLGADPCTICGSTSECGSDAEGNPWIHVQAEVGSDD